VEILKGFLYLNPSIHLWIHEIEECHEFACDEALLGQQRITGTEYGRCLLEVAGCAHQLGKTICPSGTVGMSVSQKLLTRRIQVILTKKKTSSRWVSATILTAALALTGASAMAAKGVVVDRRLSLAEATRIAGTMNKDSTMPIVVDENVLKFLNKAVGTERGRLYMRATFKRMKNYDAMIRRKLGTAKLPEELMAVPIVESGYQNTDNGVGAGLWAFIPDTARHFGLKVNDDLDERFNEELETDAAVQYYTKLYGEFKDWPLALLAYNAGEKAVRTAIASTGIHDAFRLVREHHMPKEQDYLPMTMAAIIVFKNPSLIEE
jgi:hypothetical protein